MQSQIPKPIHRWTALKLEQLDHYLQAYVIATKKAGPTYYIDAFASCGDCRLVESGQLVEGSAWRALKAVPPFTKCFFVEKHSKLARHLESRIRSKGMTNAQVFVGDCNKVILEKILPNLSRTAPTFAFLDPSGLQLHWATVQALAAHRRPWKIELLILYPYDMVIKRWLALPSMNRALTRFFGTDDWKTEYETAVSLKETTEQQQERFVAFYVRNLKKLGYKHVEPFKPLKYKQQPYYHMIFAGDNDTGAKIMKEVWSKPRPLPDQLDYKPVKRPSKWFFPSPL